MVGVVALLSSTMNLLQLLHILSMLGVVIAAPESSSSRQENLKSEKPNIILLLADNLGYNDLSINNHGTPYTPHIDSIARNGVQFRHWNSAAHLCSASRASILTGQYASPRLGIYPRVFEHDASMGMKNTEKTLASFLKEEAGYSTSIVGKWHLGHAKPEYLPTAHGFDEWLGIPYHMSGGSVDGHHCAVNKNSSGVDHVWLPLYHNTTITQQPVKLNELADRYAKQAVEFMQSNQKQGKPYFLFLPFSHVHQLCAPKHPILKSGVCDSQWSHESGANWNPSFANAVEEMDWIVGQILEAIDDATNTLVLYTSDNGPWIAEQNCAGSKGPFEGKWLQENIPDNSCTACPSDFEHVPTLEESRRCILKGSTTTATLGIPCGDDTGLGSVWESNLRMPAFVQWTSHIPAGIVHETESVSSLDIVPTLLRIAGIAVKNTTVLDGMDIGPLLFEPRNESAFDYFNDDRVLFFWRDGFDNDTTLPPPYGRNDVAAVKVGRYKAHLYTKSSHYNADPAVSHGIDDNEPLIFDIIADPAEAHPLPDSKFRLKLWEKMKDLVKEHKASVPYAEPLTLARDPKDIPCVDPNTNCRTREQVGDPNDDTSAARN